MMKKSTSDPKVKKTMLRNCEQKVTNRNKLPQDVVASCSKASEMLLQKNDQNLSKPTKCSSEVLATYLSKTKKYIPAQAARVKPINDVQFGTEITKKLNFHFNDRIYKNLVELNASVASSKSKKDKKALKTGHSIKKDVEPDIDDFCNAEKEEDLYPDVPVVKPKLRRKFENDSKDLHKLVAAFENL